MSEENFDDENNDQSNSGKFEEDENLGGVESTGVQGGDKTNESQTLNLSLGDMVQQEMNKSGGFDTSQSTAPSSNSGGIKRKREDGDDEDDEEDSQEIKKQKTEETEVDTSKIQEGMSFDNNVTQTPPQPFGMHGGMQQMNMNPSHMMPQQFQGQMPNPGNLPPGMSISMMRPMPFMGGMAPPGYGNPYLDNPPQPGMPWNPGQMQYRGPPPPMNMMYPKEFYVEVEPFFQQFLHRTPPIESLTEKLPSSKTPVIDAFIYCAICNWGVSISPSQDRLPNIFTISDFNKYWEYSQKNLFKTCPY